MQREIESQGISTVGVSIVREISEKIRPPRTYFVKYPFGHAFGEPFKKKQQLAILRDALNLLDSDIEAGTIVDSPYKWRRHKFS